MSSNFWLRVSLSTAAVLATVAMTGCQTIEYGPLGGSPRAVFAYAETRTGEGKYILKMVAPTGADAARVHMMWDRRATELCGATFQKKLFRAERPTVAYDYHGGRPGDMNLEGFLECGVAPQPAAVAN